MKKVLMFLADGFETVEALAPLDILRRAEIEVITVSVNGQKKVTSTHQVVVEADVILEELSDAQKNADAYILPGGMPGARTLADHQAVIGLINNAYADNKLVAAICAAPMLLGEQNLLNGKNAICFPGFESYLTGVKISEESVVRDGNIITGKGVGVAFEFGYAIVQALKDEAAVKELKQKMIFHR